MSKAVALVPHPGLVATDLRIWYEPRRLAYPWRRGGADPYLVLVSEVMLQQTQAARVAAVFDAFVGRFGSVGALAAAPRDEVLRSWAGLGYNRRAVALSEAARRIVADHGGVVPRDPSALRDLPGIGPYTAAAVASIAFGVPVPAIDVNVGRALARVWLGTDVHRLRMSELVALGERAIDRDRPGDWNQALMDLGREHCRPQPRCDTCPLAGRCRFVRSGARPAPPRRTQGAFRGSDRQVRGTIVRELRGCRSASIGHLIGATGFEHDRILRAVTTLHRDRVVQAGAEALAGNPRGRVRLAS